MHAYTAVIEHCPDTQLYVGYVPGFAQQPGGLRVSIEDDVDVHG